MQELLILNAKDYNLTIERLEQIKEPFIPLAEEYKTHIPNIENILNEFKENWISIDLTNKAKRIKLDIAKIRTNTKKTKDSEKDWILQIWNAIQKCHNIIVDVIIEQEEKLEQIIKFAENQEKERINKLQNDRIYEVADYWVDWTNLSLWFMKDEVYALYLAWVKLDYEKKKKEEAELKIKLEQEELKRKEEQEKIKQENDKLKEELRLKEIEIQKQKNIEYARIENEIKLKRQLEDQERIRKNKEQETLEFQQQAEFVWFLKNNWWTQEWREDFYIQHLDNWKIILYKKIAELCKN